MKVSTVCGPVDIADLGNTLIHEHMICTGPEFYYGYNNYLPRQKVLDITCAKVCHAAEKYNIDTIVDGTPPALGRDLKLLQEISERTKVNIIASTGFYYYSSFAVQSLPAETAAEIMINEIRSGPICPGMLKCAVDQAGSTPDVKKMMQITSLIHHAAKLPIFIHTSSGKRNGLEALALFQEAGVAPQKIIAGHTADTNDVTYPLELLEKGCFISIDRIGNHNHKQCAEMLMELLKQGWGKRIFLSHDHICCRDTILNDPPMSQNEPFGLDLIHAKLLPILRQNNIAENVIDQLFRKNVIELYTMDQSVQEESPR